MTKYPQNGGGVLLDPRVPELERVATLLQRRFLLDLFRQTSAKRLSIPQFTLLGFLAGESGVPMGVLAKKMGHATSATTGLVDRLESVGLVKRHAQEGDRRQKLVGITPKGKALMARLQAELRHHLSEILGKLETSDQDAWVRIYRVMENYCSELPRN
ncbi:MAG: MarR family transcriptional regulator [Verrucomicrobia bacterium]|nr:MarR family transcriptional regulator [Verrucomicrobiota bacterium]